jgi:hypothetical protein
MKAVIWGRARGYVADHGGELVQVIGRDSDAAIVVSLEAKFVPLDELKELMSVPDMLAWLDEFTAFESDSESFQAAVEEMRGRFGAEIADRMVAQFRKYGDLKAPEL